MSVCAHGSLARKCELCDRDAEIAALRAALAQALQALDVTASNIRHIWSNGSEDGVYSPYAVWLDVVEQAAQAAKDAA